MKPYVVITPSYNYTSGGIKVMWGLYGHLLARGYEAYVNEYPAGKNFIVILPEIFHRTEEFKNKKVARYVLNKPGVMGAVLNGVVTPGPKSFDKDEDVFYFSKMFGGQDGDNYLFLPVINTDLFKDYGRTRDKDAVFFGKGEDLRLHPSNAIVIDRNVASDQQNLCDVLNTCTTVYSYDPVSAITEVARLCGCNIVYLSDAYTAKDYEKYEPGTNGMSFNINSSVRLDSKEFRKHYLSLKQDFENKLDRFVEITQA